MLDWSEILQSVFLTEYILGLLQQFFTLRDNEKIVYSDDEDDQCVVPFISWDKCTAVTGEPLEVMVSEEGGEASSKDTTGLFCAVNVASTFPNVVGVFERSNEA